MAPISQSSPISARGSSTPQVCPIIRNKSLPWEHIDKLHIVASHSIRHSLISEPSRGMSFEHLLVALLFSSTHGCNALKTKQKTNVLCNQPGRCIPIRFISRPLRHRSILIISRKIIGHINWFFPFGGRPLQTLVSFKQAPFKREMLIANQNYDSGWAHHSVKKQSLSHSSRQLRSILTKNCRTETLFGQVHFQKTNWEKHCTLLNHKADVHCG